MNIDIDHIRLLHLLVRHDMVLSRAAEALKLSQPSASRKLKELESALGLPLIKRKGKRFDGLTPFATRIMGDVETIDTALNNINRLAREQKAEAQEVLSVATTHAQARYFLPAIIERFQAKWPKVEFKIHQDMPANITDLVKRGEVDVAVCTEAVACEPDLVFEPGYEWQHCVCVPQNHALASGPLDMTRIAEHPILTYVSGITERKALEAAFSEQGVSLNVAIAATDTDVLKTFIRMGLGCGLIGSMSYDVAQDKDLVIRPIGGLPRFRISTAWKKGRYLPPYVRAFIEMVKRESPYFEAKIEQNLYAFETPSDTH